MFCQDQRRQRTRQHNSTSRTADKFSSDNLQKIFDTLKYLTLAYIFKILIYALFDDVLFAFQPQTKESKQIKLDIRDNRNV